MWFYKQSADSPIWDIIVKILAPTFFAIICVYGGGCEFWHFVYQKSSYSWPETTMTVTDSYMLGQTKVNVEYKFEVDGVEYDGSDVVNRYTFVPATSPHRELLKKYSRWTSHPVYYYPADPAKYSVINRGGGWVIQLIGSTALMMLGVFMASRAIKAIINWKWYRQQRRVLLAPK